MVLLAGHIFGACISVKCSSEFLILAFGYQRQLPYFVLPAVATPSLDELLFMHRSVVPCLAVIAELGCSATKIEELYYVLMLSDSEIPKFVLKQIFKTQVALILQTHEVICTERTLPIQK